MEFRVKGVNVKWEDMRPDNPLVGYREKVEFAQRNIDTGIRKTLFDFFHFNWDDVPATAREMIFLCDYMERLAEFAEKNCGFVDEALLSTARAIRDCMNDFTPSSARREDRRVGYIFGSDWTFIFEHTGDQQDTRKKVAASLVPLVCKRYNGKVFQLCETPSHVITSQHRETDVVLTDFPRSQHGIDYLVACGRVASPQEHCGSDLNYDFMKAGVLPFMDCTTTDQIFSDYRKQVA